MTKRCQVASLLTLTLSILFAVPAGATWPVGLLGDAKVEIEDMATAADSGYSYVVGRSDGPFKVDEQPVCEYQGTAIFIAKFNAWGNLVWSQCMTGSTTDQGMRIALDTAENAYVTGTFHDSLTVGDLLPIKISEEGIGGDLFVVKFKKKDGSPAWAVRAGGSAADESNAIAFRRGDQDLNPPRPDEIIVGGCGTCDVEFFNEGQADPDENVKLNGSCLYTRPIIAALDVNGNWRWVVEASTNSNGIKTGADPIDRNKISDLAVNGEGNIFALGSFYGTIKFPGGSSDVSLENGSWDLDKQDIELVKSPADWSEVTVEDPNSSPPFGIEPTINVADTAFTMTMTENYILNGEVVLEFSHAYQLATDTWPGGGNSNTAPGNICEHGAWIEYQLEGDSKWSNVPKSAIETGEYNAQWDDLDDATPPDLTDGPPGADFNDDVWCDKSDNFPNLTKVRIVMNFEGSPEIRFRWIVSTDKGNHNQDQWIIDSVRISGGDDSREYRFEKLGAIESAFFIAKIDDPVDSRPWAAAVELPAGDDPHRLVLDGDNYLLVAGSAGANVWLAKVNGATLAEEWRIPPVEGRNAALAVDATNDVYLAYSSDSAISVAKYLSDGNDFPSWPVVNATADTPRTVAINLNEYQEGNTALNVAGSFSDSAEFGTAVLKAGGDRNGFIANLGADGTWYTVPTGGTPVDVGVAIIPPDDAEVTEDLPPEYHYDGSKISDTSDIFLWSPPSANSGEAKLYPLRETPEYPTITIKWYQQGSEPQDEQWTEQEVGIKWPTDFCDPDPPCYQRHVAGAAVEIDPDPDDDLTYFNIYNGDASDAEVDASRVFTATKSGYSTIVYTEGATADILNLPLKLQVVRTLPWPVPVPSDDPVFSDGGDCVIGAEITPGPAHEQADRPGAVLNEKAFYDPSLHDREKREGTIIPVNRETCDPNSDPSCVRQADQGKEMRVAWYQENNLGVFWPGKAVEYDCEWPNPTDKLTIASTDENHSLKYQELSDQACPNAHIYSQNDPNKPGYNPNDEHAMLLPSRNNESGQELYALRADFRNLSGEDDPPGEAASDPYVLVRCGDPTTAESEFKVYKVEVGALELNFQVTAPARIVPPYPLSLFDNCPKTKVDAEKEDDPQPPLPFYRDTNDQLWARSQGTGDVLFYYPLASTWFYDLDYDDVSDDIADGCVPFLADPPGSATEPRNPKPVKYNASWPTDVPVLTVGETLLKPKRGLPDIFNQAAVKVVYDQLRDGDGSQPPATEFKNTLAQIVDPLSPRTTCATDLVSAPGNPTTWVCPAGNDLPRDDLATRVDADGMTVIVGDAAGDVVLSPTLQSRLRYNPLTNKYVFQGVFDDSGVGDPYLLPNVMTKEERDVLLSLSDDVHWQDAMKQLFALSRNPNGIMKICQDDPPSDSSKPCMSHRNVTADDILIGFEDRLGPDTNYDEKPDPDYRLEPFGAEGVNAALTAGAAQGEGFVTLAFNDSKNLALPISLEIVKVGCLQVPGSSDKSPYIGQINVIEPTNVFDEQLTLRHSNDFGGRWADLDIEWFYHPDEDGTPPSPPPAGAGWQPLLNPPKGAVEVTISGANVRTLSDNWYLVHYKGLPACENDTKWSIFAGQPGSTPGDPRAQFAQGWVKRVFTRLNPFDARVAAFHTAPTNTFASMIAQVGQRYEGPIALSDDPDNLNQIGLIEAYQTVMRRAMELSIDADSPINHEATNAAILNAASRISDFYMLLGNEAYADAQDPTVGISTDEVQFGFGTLAPTIFNFQNQQASLLDEELVLLRGRDESQASVTTPPVYNRFFWNFTQGQGEVAYALSYNISDQNADGFINEFDARKLFPQGHGDAWGHYLTALTTYYRLLWHGNYTWNPRPEAVPIAGAPVQVDYLDERKFAKAAAARARVGAEIVDLTYRREYVEDPAGQWQGYKDTDAERAWGLAGWGRRAGMGAYLDWVVGNAILPEEDTDPDHVGIQKIDRRTVNELDEIITYYLDVQSQVDEADRGLNPLGLAKGVVPFDVDPSQVDAGKTHFEQIYERATTALDNAVDVWDYANQLTRMLRFDQDQVDDITQNSLEQETDFKGRLIEIFGRPYEDDVGAGGTYPNGYDGPDLYHFFYVDLPALYGTPFAVDPISMPPCDSEQGDCDQYGRIKKFTATYDTIDGLGSFFSCGENVDEPVDCTHAFGGNQNPDCNPWTSDCPLGDTPDAQLEVEYYAWQLPNSATFALTKPSQWSGVRPATGKIQEALNEILNAQISLRKALEEYEQLRLETLNTISTLEATFNIRAEQIRILNDERDQAIFWASSIQLMTSVAIGLRRIAAAQDAVFDTAGECVPDNTILGMATGGDVFAAAKCSLYGTSEGIFYGLLTTADGLDIAANLAEVAKEDVSLQAAIDVQFADARLEQFGIAGDILDLVNREPVLRTELFARAQIAEQAMQGYRSALSEGLRVGSQLQTFRKKTAAAVQDVRHQDMAFRIFRNDALQKYRAAYDLAARYTYLAAAAYDYETNLLGTDARSGQDFLTDVVRQRSLGQVLNHEPVPGSRGLADPLARMKLNFDVLKGQMGFNNPQIETNRFSLRDEAFRDQNGPVVDNLNDAEWRAKLLEFKEDNLWDVPEFRRFARPFALELPDEPQPGLVIEFSTDVNFGMNFFGKPLASRDSAYDPTQFATRIRGVGVWFEGYGDLPLSNTPRVYLIPVGADFLRPPTSGEFTTREWSVVDQRIPVPFPIGVNDLEDPEWTPLTDMLNGSFGEIRRFGSFRAYPYSEPFDASQIIPDSRLIGRSVWNTRWLLIIPGGTLLNDPEAGLETFVNGVRDIRIFFKTYAYQGF